MDDYRKLLYASYRTGHYEAINPGGLSHSHIEDFRSELADFLPRDRKARVVDLGCGKGFLVQFLLREGFENVLGIDISPDQVEFGRGLGLPVLQADALEFLRQNRDLNLVICSDVIEHFGKDEALDLLEAIHAALAPGGAVIIRTINCSSMLGSDARYTDFTHETGFTERSLRQVLTACGFERILITDSRVPFRWKPKRVVRWSLFKLWRIALRTILALEAGRDASPRLLGVNLIAHAFKHSDAKSQEAAADLTPRG